MAAWVACSPALSSPHRAGSSGRAAQSVVSVAARTGRVSMTSFNGARPACDSRGGCTMVAPAVALSTAEPMPNGTTARRRRWHHRVHRHQLTSIPPLPPYPSRSVQLPPRSPAPGNEPVYACQARSGTPDVGQIVHAEIGGQRYERPRNRRPAINCVHARQIDSPGFLGASATARHNTT